MRAKNNVSIHAPAWGATCLPAIFFSILARFNPRARVGRDQITRSLALAIICFNPRARVGRDLKIQIKKRKWLVSIHAPAWGATRGGLKGNPGQVVSIHAPAWGATRLSCSNACWGASFNPRARVGRDLRNY